MQANGLFAGVEDYGRFTACQVIADVERLLRLQVTALGFSKYCYLLREPVPANELRPWTVHTYPDAWMRRYVEHGYVAIDPVVRHCLQSSDPVRWTDNLHAQVKEFWQKAREYGLRVGCSQGAWSCGGTFGQLSLAREFDAISDVEYADIQGRLFALTNLTHATVVRLRKSDLRREQPLSKREIDVLRWIADGKTSEDVGKILSVSVATVNFHVASVIRKLEASNKVGAAVRAAALGYLWK